MNRKGSAPLIIGIIILLIIIVGVGVGYFMQHEVPTGQTAASTTNSIVPTATTKTQQAIQGNQSLWQNSDALIVPISRTLIPITPTTTTQFSISALTLKVPWVGTSSEVYKVGLNVKFKNGAALFIIKSPTSSLLETLQSPPLNLNIKTNYDALATVLNATSTGISTSTIQNSDVPAYELLDLKAVLAPYKNKNIYSFQNTQIKGFQFGDATSTASSVIIDFYDGNDDEYNLIISGSQGEVDYVLSSITESH
jgi:hypothetical protein